jgi:hypothetical protein
MMNYQTTLAPILAGLGGLWMLASGAMMHRGWGMMPMRGRWEIVLISAIVLSLAPQYRRSLGITIVIVAILNLIFGIGGLFSSILAIGGGWLAISHHPATEN